VRAVQLIGGRHAAAYNRDVSGNTIYGPMVCVCPQPQADPTVNFGECARCRRKPLSLFRTPAVALPAEPQELRKDWVLSPRLECAEPSCDFVCGLSAIDMNNHTRSAHDRRATIAERVPA
jgi:hypothetical protein